MTQPKETKNELIDIYNVNKQDNENRTFGELNNL